MNANPKPWLFVHSAVDDSGLRPSEFRVLGHVARRADGQNRCCFEAIPKMAKACGLNHQTVRACLRSLVADGWLLRIARPGNKDGDGYALAPVPPAPAVSSEPSQKTGMQENRSSTISSAAPLQFLAVYPSQKERTKDIHEGDPLKVTGSAAPDEPPPPVEHDLFAEPSSPARKCPSTSSTRPRDELFDALAIATGRNPDEMTKPEARACGVALAGIRKVCPNLSPAEFERRAANYQRMFSRAPITPSALANHWSALGASAPRPTPAERVIVN